MEKIRIPKATLTTLTRDVSSVSSTSRPIRKLHTRDFPQKYSQIYYRQICQSKAPIECDFEPEKWRESRAFGSFRAGR